MFLISRSHNKRFLGPPPNLSFSEHIVQKHVNEIVWVHTNLWPKHEISRILWFGDFLCIRTICFLQKSMIFLAPKTYEWDINLWTKNNYELPWEYVTLSLSKRWIKCHGIAVFLEHGFFRYVTWKYHGILGNFESTMDCYVSTASQWGSDWIMVGNLIYMGYLLLEQTFKWGRPPAMHLCGNPWWTFCTLSNSCLLWTWPLYMNMVFILYCAICI